MTVQIIKHKSVVAAFAIAMTLSLPLGAAAQEAETEVDRETRLLQELAEAEASEAARLEKEIRLEWGKSGSAAMDLLLKRGQDALEVQDLSAATQHFTALTDHAPEFAEGWYGLAMAYFQADLLGPTADALERTLALNPHHFGALRGLGAVFEQVDKPGLAYEAYSRVLEIRPHDSDVEEALERLEPRVRGTSL